MQQNWLNKGLEGLGAIESKGYDRSVGAGSEIEPGGFCLKTVFGCLNP